RPSYRKCFDGRPSIDYRAGHYERTIRDGRCRVNYRTRMNQWGESITCGFESTVNVPAFILVTVANRHGDIALLGRTVLEQGIAAADHIRARMPIINES